MKDSEGVVYIVTEENYFREFEKSAKQLKKTNDVPITLITLEEKQYDFIDENIVVDDPGKGSDKIYLLEKTPYDRTLYLDTDTYVVDEINELFDVLNQFELAIRRAPQRASEEMEDVPPTFSELNTGVISYRKTDDVQQLFDDWKELYEDRSYESHRDQPVFRKALYYSDVDFTTIPSEYNCRFGIPGYLYNEAKILHGRLDKFDTIGYRFTVMPEKAQKQLNNKTSSRVHYLKRNNLKIKKINPRSWDKLYSALKWYGIKETIERTIEKIKGLKK
ncbi:putative nucleotide-diphospho-sugar transferase [Candidatus Nanohalobium constans]|uniref:Glycosyl transferase family 8 n=1 Tax=Candidatus Nanohalobium constans TaxID=2565781 RepID=A0A5Q0UHD6_9ARCH|nr:putative nucleotide-diphospho-sugar transferase [Candidatus Nanohalobium constans]QGA81058.1 glycosyl transferase family 8 [Candidatus Nanohalobium constans]